MQRLPRTSSTIVSANHLNETINRYLCRGYRIHWILSNGEGRYAISAVKVVAARTLVHKGADHG